MKGKPKMIRCTCCSGSGEVPFTGEFADTLAFVEANYGRGDDFTATEVGKAMAVKATTMSNRLAALERMGFLVGTPYGRRRLFKQK